MKARIGKWGNNLGVRLPQPFALANRLRQGMNVEIAFSDVGLVLSRSPKKYSLKDLVARITPENLHGEMDWGAIEGREIWKLFLARSCSGEHEKG